MMAFTQATYRQAQCRRTRARLIPLRLATILVGTLQRVPAQHRSPWARHGGPRRCIIGLATDLFHSLPPTCSLISRRALVVSGSQPNRTVTMVHSRARFCPWSVPLRLINIGSNSGHLGSGKHSCERSRGGKLCWRSLSGIVPTTSICSSTRR